MFGGIKSNHAENCTIQRKSVVIFSKQISTGKYNCWIFIQEKLRYNNKRSNNNSKWNHTLLDKYSSFDDKNKQIHIRKKQAFEITKFHTVLYH
jgi:hypothetical protein